MSGSPAFEITCGEYTYPVSVYGNCVGECGDGICNPFADENYDNCSDDCGYCGDDLCQRAYEAAGA
jgi:hypothetical protein